MKVIYIVFDNYKLNLKSLGVMDKGNSDSGPGAANNEEAVG
jgi:hypothetical protein